MGFIVIFVCFDGLVENKVIGRNFNLDIGIFWNFWFLEVE